MLSNLFAVIIVGGLPVLWTYYIAYREEEQTRQYIYVPDTWYRYWIASMGLTVLSYFVLAYTFIWGIEKGTIFSASPTSVEPYLCATYVLFFASAGQWVHHVIYDIEKGRKTWWHLMNLSATAAFSVAICILAFGIQGIDNVLLAFARLSGIWLVVHHLFVDALAWYSVWSLD